MDIKRNLYQIPLKVNSQVINSISVFAQGWKFFLDPFSLMPLQGLRSIDRIGDFIDVR